MAFIIFFFFLKKFEKVEKTGIISTKFSLRCTPSVILGWPIIIWTGLNIKICVAQKVYELWNCSFAKILPWWTIILAKEQFHNSYTFWVMPISIFSPVQIIITHPLQPFFFDNYTFDLFTVVLWNEVHTYLLHMAMWPKLT